jgi:hypothetical protein
MQQQSHDPAVRNDGNLGTDTGPSALSSFPPASDSEDTHEHGETWHPKKFPQMSFHACTLDMLRVGCHARMLGRVECPANAEIEAV